MQLLLGLLIYLSASAYNKPTMDSNVITNSTIITKRLVRKGIEEEIVKCTNILNWHTQIAIRTGYANRRSKRRKLVPSEEFKNCTGIAILRLHLGSLSFGKLNGGTGLVLRKLDSGSWSAPSAFRMAGYGLGIGWQVGYEMNEIIIFLNTKKAVDMFYKRSFGFRGSAAFAAGATKQMDVSPVKMYTYSKGFYLGISLEGSVFWQRKEANEMFYRHPYTAEELLFGSVPAPRAANPLYDALWEAENGQVPRDKHEPTRQDEEEPVQAVVTGPGTALAGEGQHSEESHEGFHNSTDWEDITDIGVDGPEVLPPSTGRRGRPGLLLESSNQTLGG